MSITRRRRVIAALFAAIVASAGVALAIGPAIAGTEPSGGSSDAKPKAVATLKIIHEGASVRRDGKDEFKPATDGQKLRVGDTVKTDDTGFAQINYRDAGDTFTRLDVNTEFTIVSLTDDQGNRKVDGSLDVGRTWNRTTGLTESESFSTEGAGATAAVTGSAYFASCLSPGNCTYISVVDGLTITTVDGEVQHLDPLQECDATEVTDTDSNLCAVPQDVALEVLLADKFIAANFFLDALGGFPLPVVGIVTVENGQVTQFTPIAPTPPPSTPPSPNPVVNTPAVNITQNNSGYQGTGTTNGIETGDLDDVYFQLQGSDPNGVEFYWVFDTLPDNVGTIYVPCLNSSPDNSNLCNLEGPSYTPVEVGTRYFSDTEFYFSPFEDPPTDPTTDSFTFHAVNANGDESPSTEVPVTVHCDSCEASTTGTSAPSPDSSKHADRNNQQHGDNTPPPTTTPTTTP